MNEENKVEERAVVPATANDGPPLLEGTADNGAIVDVAFPFYRGPAGLRGRGGGQVEFAFFRPPPFRFWREALVEGLIDGQAYRVTASQVSATTKAMIVVRAQKI